MVKFLRFSLIVQSESKESSQKALQREELNSIVLHMTLCLNQ